MTTIFISDLHLDPSRPHVADAFVELLHREAPRCAAIYVLGDLYEAWVGDDDDDAWALTTQDALRNAAKMCPVSVMHGNRDFLMRTGFAERNHIALLGDRLSVDLYGTKTLLMHGDLLCTEDAAYQKLRVLLRDDTWQLGMLNQPLAERRAIAANMRAQSRSANANKPQNIMDASPTAVLAEMQQAGVRQLIHGHTHRPTCHEFAHQGQTLRRWVLGDWTDYGWLLRVDARGQRLERWPIGARRRLSAEF